MTRASAWLAELACDAEAALSAEQNFRADFARRVAELAELRAEAFRRKNLMAAVAEGVGGAEDEEDAVARGLAVLRARLGWASDSEARSEIIGRFAPICAACFAASRESGDDEEEPADPAAELAAFEAWFLEARGQSFWVLFEVEIPETPLVDF